MQVRSCPNASLRRYAPAYDWKQTDDNHNDISQLIDSVHNLLI